MRVSRIAAQMHTGSSLGFGGVGVVSLKFSMNFFEIRRLVIFQQPRPGPPLPKGESYLTIGWKQVSSLKHLNSNPSLKLTGV